MKGKLTIKAWEKVKNKKPGLGLGFNLIIILNTGSRRNKTFVGGRIEEFFSHGARLSVGVASDLVVVAFVRSVAMFRSP